jgi:hypothetical protein
MTHDETEDAISFAAGLWARIGGTFKLPTFLVELHLSHYYGVAREA